jgi:hypothetical protein
LIALVCIFRQDVKLWAFSKYGIRLGGGGGGGSGSSKSGSGNKKQTLTHRYNANAGAAAAVVDDDQYYGSGGSVEKIYDAYFVYSINDTDLLTQILLPELQNLGYNISLFNHHNKPSIRVQNEQQNYQITNYLIDTLKNGTDSSHKMVMVLSFNFLQTEWCESNFRCALQALIDNMMLNRSNKNIILILTVPIQIVQMDPVLQLLIRTCTVICWGEKRFWTKLRYALPDVSSDKKYIQSENNIAHRYTAAPTSTLQSSRGGGGVGPIILPAANNNASDWYNLSPVVCSGYSMPINQYQEPNYPPQQYFTSNEHEMPNNFRRPTTYDYEQPDYNSRGPQSIGGSSTCLGHVYSTIPETPPLSSSSNASSPTLSHKHAKASHLIEQQHCDSANNDHFV